MEQRATPRQLGKRMTRDEASIALVIHLEGTCCNQGSAPQQAMEVIQVGAVLATPAGEDLGGCGSPA